MTGYKKATLFTMNGNIHLLMGEWLPSERLTNGTILNHLKLTPQEFDRIQARRFVNVFYEDHVCYYGLSTQYKRTERYLLRHVAPLVFAEERRYKRHER